MILLTFSPVSDQFYAECNIIGKYHTIIDLYNRADKSKINVKTLNRKDFQDIDLWMINARKNYLEFLAELSRVSINKDKTIRDFKLFNFPLYWITAISEKQYRNHWLFSFFIFKEFLTSNVYKNESIVIYLNHQNYYLKKFILKLNKNNSINRSISFYIPIKVNNVKLFFNIIKTQFQNINFKYPSKNASNIQEHSVQIITTTTNRFLYHQFLSFSAINKLSVSFKPLALSNINNVNINFLSNKFLQYKPSLFYKFKILIKSISLFFKIAKLKNDVIINQTPFSIEIIKREFFDVLKYAQAYFINYLWYKNYFTSIKNNTLFFLDDEFYVAGRIISKACTDANNKNVKLFGLQHGMFSHSHTVYAILQKEIDSIVPGDSFPLPQKFIVWGNYFKDVFKFYNNLSDQFIQVLGSPHFIQLKNSIDNYKILPPTSKYILWCTTGKENFMFELAFVKKLIKKYQFSLLVRLHPGNHIDKKFVISNLEGINFKFDEENDIYKSILKSQFVITSAHSTIVLDCIICNKQVYRIIFDRDDDIFHKEQNLIFNLRKIEDIDQNYISLNSSQIHENSYLYLSDDRWQQFLNRELTENV
ncbi:MAG: hypothetical protein KatS3mg002_1281 [Candidatus Woesearchaeota archaeon]|nr:MAG: hypothetical protein KatS3mg002_1281 [Candidatus Woesearchaeota archaeon]